jgi:hypothetical protein
MLTTVGRGGDGQKIRDEILHIMHRNHISERKGLWMEEWHQKLHNNTTPDDVHICEAYLAFLESGGNLGSYWRVLSDAGACRGCVFEEPSREGSGVCVCRGRVCVSLQISDRASHWPGAAAQPHLRRTASAGLESAAIEQFLYFHSTLRMAPLPPCV